MEDRILRGWKRRGGVGTVERLSVAAGWRRIGVGGAERGARSVPPSRARFQAKFVCRRRRALRSGRAAGMGRWRGALGGRSSAGSSVSGRGGRVEGRALVFTKRSGVVGERSSAWELRGEVRRVGGSVDGRAGRWGLCLAFATICSRGAILGKARLGRSPSGRTLVFNPSGQPS